MENSINLEQPRVALSIVGNQQSWQWTNNNDFYKMVPAPYYSFYNNWVRLWLQWYDGYVPWIHGSQRGLLSTRLATTLVNRAADSIFGGSIMFANARKPLKRITKDNGKSVGAALDFISNNWALETGFSTVYNDAVNYALAGGFSLIKLNNDGGNLWCEACRPDRFWIDIDGRGRIRKSVCALSFYERITKKKDGDAPRYALIEERRYEKMGLFDEEIPIIEYKMYETSAQIQYFSTSDNYVRWEDLPKDVRQAFKSEYGVELNKPQAMNGFEDLAVYMLRRKGVSNVPQINLGESMLGNILTYLYEYDFYNTCFNTDMYLARGRILVPKALQSPQARTGAQNAGLDDFLYTKVESMNTEEQKPEAIQFELRATEWKEARNNLLESIATGIGLSVSTLASYLNDGSNRTAKEVSAEESATALFIEGARRAFEKPANQLIKAVLRFYGFVDDVEIRWTRTGMTNITVLTDTLAKAVSAGLISQKKAHHAYNYDDDEEQNEEDYALVEKEQAERQQSSLFGDYGNV